MYVTDGKFNYKPPSPHMLAFLVLITQKDAGWSE